MNFDNECCVSCFFFPVLIWDDSKKEVEKKFVLEFTFAQPVVGVRMKTDK